LSQTVVRNKPVYANVFGSIGFLSFCLNTFFVFLYSIADLVFLFLSFCVTHSHAFSPYPAAACAAGHEQPPPSGQQPPHHQRGTLWNRAHKAAGKKEVGALDMDKLSDASAAASLLTVLLEQNLSDGQQALLSPILR